MSRSSTSSSSRSVALRFGLRAVLFALPIALAIAPVEVLFWRSGETWPIERVLDASVGKADVLYGREYLSQQINLHKLGTIRRLRPRLLVVGSSRVMQLRAHTFDPVDRDFYNGGGLLQGIEDLMQLSLLTARREIPAPDAIIVGLDPWWFKQGPRPSSWLAPGELEDVSYQAVAHLYAYRKMLRLKRFPDMRVAVAGFTPDGRYRAIGAQALHGNGFRSDGSYRYGEWLEEFGRTRAYHDHQAVAERARAGTRQFTPAEAVSPSSVGLLVLALRILRDSGVEVYVMMPPNAIEVDAAAVGNAGVARWWEYYWNELPRVLEAVGISVVSVRTLRAYRLPEAYLVDGMHPGEVVMAMMLAQLLDHVPPNSGLREVDVDRLRERIRAAASPLVIDTD